MICLKFKFGKGLMGVYGHFCGKKGEWFFLNEDISFFVVVLVVCGCIFVVVVFL